MKLCVCLLNRAAIGFLVAPLCVASLTHAATTNTSSKPSKTTQPRAAVTNVLRAEPEIPESVFVVPVKREEGKDPFFPRSDRPYVGTAITSKTNPPVTIADVPFGGISGTPENPLAIIGTHTFAPGEDGEVTVKGKRYRIRCVEINLQAGTAVIQMGGERRILRLPNK